MFGMMAGSIAGGWLPTIFGASAVSFATFIGGAVGALFGVYIAYKLTA
jgi:hypothetical protein